jgi:putative membrane protein
VIATGLVLAGLAALVHVYIFVLESVLWTSDRARATFGTTREEAEATRALAFNQGFYNLFLAITVVVGIVVVAAGHTAVGAALVLTGAGSMVAAGLVLMLSDRTKTSAALKQAVLPLLGVVALVVGLVA